MQDIFETMLNDHRDREVYTPTLFNLGDAHDKATVEQLIADKSIVTTIDDYEEQQLELYGINNPTKVYTPTFKEEFRNYYEALKREKPLYEDGRWVYFPWSSKLVHILNDDDFQKVRTARNRNLINHEEQKRFYNATIGIGGLSVGSSVAFALVLQGGGRHIKLADMDRVALSNTNRIVTGVDSLGILKVKMAARKIYEINPYAKVEIFEDGLHKENIDKFFEGLDVVIDELDNLAVKYLIREYSKKYKVPVVMAADNGDNAVVDVERYDLDPAMPFFHGRMGTDISYEMLSKLDKFGIGKMITKHVGPENVTVRMQESLLEMGKTIVSWPQLGGAALINGAAVAYCVRKIVNGQSLETNRALISLDEKLIPEYHADAEVTKRKDAETAFRKLFGL